jgi:hypothetical protein
MDAVELIFNCAIVVVLGYGGVWLIKWIRRQLWDDALDAESTSGGFTMAALRELQKSGKITLDEYERLKILIIAAAKRAADRIAAQSAERKEKQASQARRFLDRL